MWKNDNMEEIKLPAFPTANQTLGELTNYTERVKFYLGKQM